MFVQPLKNLSITVMLVPYLYIFFFFINMITKDIVAWFDIINKSNIDSLRALLF